MDIFRIVNLSLSKIIIFQKYLKSIKSLKGLEKLELLLKICYTLINKILPQRREAMKEAIKIKSDERIIEDKLVSFIIPVYKTEKCLKKCIECLLEQDYKNIELIFVLDGYSKKAIEIISSFKDKRIQHTKVIKHGGAPKARNEGYPLSKGDYVSFWDSDCYAEPGMVRMWVKAFNKYNVDFVYSGYRFLDENHTFFQSDMFNKYLLTCNNYISTMFPMKREIFPGFDESLKSLQDWDMWLTITERGYKGHFIEGSGFSTEFRKKSISAQGCTHDMWLERYNTVRNKHNIKDRAICFTSSKHRFRAIELAENFKQDFCDMPSYHPHEYKAIHSIGFYPSSMETTSSFYKSADGRTNYVNILSWTGIDIESIFTLPYRVVKIIGATLKRAIKYHFCEDEISRKMLKEIGINSKILMLPIDKGIKDIPFPKKFKIFYENDGATKEFIDDIIKSCPDIPFESPDSCKIEDYSCFVSFTESKVPSENAKRFLAAGRYMVSNYNLPYMGFIEYNKEDIIESIRNIKKLCKDGKINKKAQEYYLEQTDENKFIRTLKRCR